MPSHAHTRIAAQVSLPARLANFPKGWGSALFILFVCLLWPGFAGAAVHYVAPGGTSQGTGSLDRPWDLQTALSQPASVQPGDTIWVRGGTYISAISDGFTSKL